MVGATTDNGTHVPLTNTRERYGRVAQLFHWAVALLFLAQYPIAGIAEYALPRENGADVAVVASFFSWHKTLGVVIFVLAVGRIAWALANPHPRLLNAERRGEAFAAATIHWVLYAAILLMPISGMVVHFASTGFAPLLIPFPEHIGFVPVSQEVMEVASVVHGVLAKVVLAAVVLHIAGALKHHLVDRDLTLARMLPWRSPPIPASDTALHGPSRAVTLAVGWGVLAAAMAAALAYGVAATSTVEDTARVGASVPASADQTAVQAADPNRWLVDHEASRLGLGIVQMGSPVKGEFAGWDADIVFDEAEPAQARVKVTVDLGTIVLGTVADQARGPDFLAVDASPTATFAGEGFEPLGEGRYRTTGTLTLRDVQKPVPLEFDLAISGDTATAMGSTELNRLDWNVGAEGYPDESSVGFAVTIDFEVEARRSP